MLSKNLHEAINAQINAELWSAYLYLAMSMDAEAKGLKLDLNALSDETLEAQGFSREEILEGLQHVCDIFGIPT